MIVGVGTMFFGGVTRFLSLCFDWGLFGLNNTRTQNLLKNNLYIQKDKTTRDKGLFIYDKIFSSIKKFKNYYWNKFPQGCPLVGW